jgi:hypothetical protein
MLKIHEEFRSPRTFMIIIIPNMLLPFYPSLVTFFKIIFYKILIINIFFAEKMNTGMNSFS